jgi:hypothetical protein
MADARRTSLLTAKLTALVRSRWPDAELTPRPFAAGASCIAASKAGVPGWLLIDERTVDADPLDGGADQGPTLPPGWAGGAVVWGHRNSVTELHLIADGASDGDCRRIAALRTPPSLWRSEGRELIPVATATVATTPRAVAEVDPRVLQFVALIEAAGAEAIVDHGVLRAELLGLECATAEIDPSTGEVSLAIGVGRHDRLANAMMRGDVDPSLALREAVDAVRSFRAPGAPPHPANQLARSRWLRSVLVAQPSMVGCAELAAIPGLEPPRLKIGSCALLLGHTDGGAPVLIGASVGIDLDAPVTVAAVARELDISDVRLVVPAADAVPAIGIVCEAADPIVQLVTVTADWPSIA